jgi:hypothetical protein
LKHLSYFVAIVAACSGCAKDYEKTAVRAWDLMADQRQATALKIYESDVTRPQDELLRLMDEGILLRTAGQFKESNEKFFAAARLIEGNGYVSLSQEAARLLTDENQKAYQGEDFEKVLVHLYLGLNFLSLNDDEAALVETRRVNEILYQMISEGKKSYELNPFARYLGAMLFEKDKEVNDAFIAYQNTYDINPLQMRRFEVLGVDLVRTAKRLGFDDELSKIETAWGENIVKRGLQSVAEKQGAVALLFEVGKSPQKISEIERRYQKSQSGTMAEVIIPLPVYQRRWTRIHSARLVAEGDESAEAVAQTLYDIEDSAEKFLADRRGRLIARALLSAGVKVGVAAAVGKATDNKDLGALAGLLLLASAQADTRSWLLLPGNLQVAKLFLKPGRYELRIDYLSATGKVVDSELLQPIAVKAFETTFIQRRSFR